ncbi:hypothetical protein BJ742DRAFT_774760 [Cladochytrium replicatum]|nr:hypothetical protein BJ742DRAFT_774760 [Cladochytrium replicatum]
MSSDSSSTTERSRTAVSSSSSSIPRSPAASPTSCSTTTRHQIRKLPHQTFSIPFKHPSPAPLFIKHNLNGSKSAQATPAPPPKSRSSEIVRQLLNATNSSGRRKAALSPPEPSMALFNLHFRL